MYYILRVAEIRGWIGAKRDAVGIVPGLAPNEDDRDSERDENLQDPELKKSTTSDGTAQNPHERTCHTFYLDYEISSTVAIDTMCSFIFVRALLLPQTPSQQISASSITLPD